MVLAVVIGSAIISTGPEGQTSNTQPAPHGVLSPYRSLSNAIRPPSGLVWVGPHDLAGDVAFYDSSGPGNRVVYFDARDVVRVRTGKPPQAVRPVSVTVASVTPAQIERLRKRLPLRRTVPSGIGVPALVDRSGLAAYLPWPQRHQLVTVEVGDVAQLRPALAALRP
jgi:hypothetical protein